MRSPCCRAVLQDVSKKDRGCRARGPVSKADRIFSLLATQQGRFSDQAQSAAQLGSGDPTCCSWLDVARQRELRAVMERSFRISYSRSSHFRHALRRFFDATEVLHAVPIGEHPHSALMPSRVLELQAAQFLEGEDRWESTLRTDGLLQQPAHSSGDESPQCE